MRICLLTPQLYPHLIHGGIGKYVAVLAEGLAKRGHQVTVAGFELHEEERIQHSWGESLNLKHLGGSAHKLGGIRGALAIREFLLRSRGAFDVVEISNWPGHGAFVPKTDFPCITRISSPTAECLPDSAQVRLVSWLEGRTCRRANMILTHSNAMWETAVKLYRCKKVAHAIVPHGLPDINVNGISPPVGRISIIYIGRAEQRKGTDVLIRALSDVLPACPRVYLTIVGGDFDRFAERSGELRELWTGLKARFGDRISQLGLVSEEEKCRKIAESHWLVVPSRFESFGLVVIEAMRAGTPVLAADGGGLREACAKGPGNLVYGPPEDIAALVRLLKVICERGSEYALALRSETRQAYLKWYSADRFVEDSLTQYENTINMKKRRFMF